MRSHNATPVPGEDVLLSSRPLLLIDKARQIDWAVTGNGDATQGRHCWDVLGCAARSPAQCNAVRCPKPGPAARRRSRFIPAPAYPNDVCLISSIPLPFRGLLVWGPQSWGAVHTSAVLHVVASLAGTVLARDLANGGEGVAELIRIAMGADNCQLFLADLRGRELLLAAGAGSNRSPLTQQARFDSGEGFAGLAFAQRRQVTSRTVNSDTRVFLEEMTERGVGSFISVPIPAPGGRIVGCLNVAWRHNEVAVEGLADALMSAAPSLGNAICAVYWTLRERIVQASANGSGSQPMLSMLQVLHETVGADAGSLVMWDERSRRVQQTSFFGAAPPSCPWLAAPETSPCSSRENQSCFRLIALAGPDDRWPEPCRQMQFDGPTVCCIPVTGQAARGGRVLLGFRRNPPDSPVRLLVPLQVMVEQMGLHLQEPVSPQIAVALEPAVPQLQIRCFGHFEVVIGGKNLPPSAFQRRDALTLLKVLVLRAGKHLHRTKLIEWLWPDADETAGINRLHGVVHALRTVIEPHAAERRWKYVLNEGDTYTFCPGDSTSVDLISFQELLALARRDLRDGVFAPHITHYLEQAVELYRGDLFEDDLYGEWCDVERVAVQREFIDALANLARVYLTLGEAKRAIVALRRALCHDPSREDLHHELIRCLMRLKRHQDAKQQVAGCVRYLREELGVEPGSETLRLHHSLVTGAHGA